MRDGRTDTVLTQKEGDVRHCQQSSFCNCKPNPVLRLVVTFTSNGTFFSCSIVDMYNSGAVSRVRYRSELGGLDRVINEHGPDHLTL